MNGKWDTPKLRRTTSQYHAVDARRASQRPDTRSSYGPSFMALRVPRTFDGPAFGGVLDVLLPTPPTAPESAYSVVEPLQNAAPERRSLPSNQQRRTAPRVCSLMASRLSVRRCGLRREPAEFWGTPFGPPVAVGQSPTA